MDAWLKWGYNDMMNEQLKKEQMKQKIDQLSEALTQIFTEDSEEMKLPVSTKKRKGNPDFRIEDAEEDALPLVSVIMPVYNAEKYLKNSLHAVLNQKYRNLEVICINDGSTDNSLSILQNIAKTDDRVRIINQEMFSSWA